MFSLLTFLIGAIFNLLKSKKELIIQVCLHKKELEILKRQNQKKRLKFHHCDRIIFSILNKIGNIKETISIVKPETVLQWQKQLVKRVWTYKIKNRVGRPPIQNEIKQIILSMKNDNLYWGYKKIQGELLKLGIGLDQKTIRNILNDFRRRRKVRISLTWRRFLRLQIHSIYAMDFFTIDTILNQRYYVFFIIHHKCWVIAQFSITQNPCREFVRQQLIEFSDKLKNNVYVIHDNASQFHFNLLHFGLKDIRISVNAPNMNSIAERFVGSVRREALNFFLLLSEKQIRGILTEYIEYYNALRPHQGIAQNIPQGYKPQHSGEVRKIPILGGLCYHYKRQAA